MGGVRINMSGTMTEMYIQRSGSSNRKNNVNTLAEQLSINIDTIKVEKQDRGFKIKIAFLDAFGDAYFSCETIDYQHVIHLN